MIQLIVLLAVVGFLVWLLLTYVPMLPVMKNIILAVVVLCVILYLLSVFGIADIPLPRAR